MPAYKLDEFTSAFLERQNLDGFQLVFRPTKHGTKPRRAKKSNTQIEATGSPRDAKELNKNRTVADLLQLFQKLVPETVGWLQAPRAYVLQLLDDEGKVVRREVLLSEARELPQRRRRECEDKAKKIIGDAFGALEDLLEEGAVPAFVRQELKRHFG